MLRELQRGGALSWHQKFFKGLALEFWRDAVPSHVTAEETAFIEYHLGLFAGAKVLDAPCGDGRLAVPLAERGYMITGIDLSADSLDHARQQKETNASFVEHDMIDMPWQAAFDGAFCMGNSFGYFDRKDTEHFLSSIGRALKPGATFILDTCLAAETFLVLGGQKEWVQVGDIFMLMNNQYDCQSGRLHSTFRFMRGPQHEEKQSTHWIFTVADICSMCERAGLHVSGLLGSLQGEPYEIGSERLLLIARKPEV